MNEHQEIIPEQKEGVQKHAIETVEFDSVENARNFFRTARQRLLNVNGWKEICEGWSSTFLLRNPHGEPVGYRLPEVGDYFQINIPGPGPQEGGGRDWVRVEAVEDSKNISADEMTLMRVRPAPSPLNDQDDVAHFLDQESTSTFIVSRLGNKVTAEVYGNNETANTKTDSLMDKVRNVATAVGSWLGFSDMQWGRLVKAIVAQ